MVGPIWYTKNRVTKAECLKTPAISACDGPLSCVESGGFRSGLLV
jgi:hypothetical protein